jgi:hypothetical protein
LYGDSSGNFILGTDGSDKLLVNSSGNVGIGTASLTSNSIIKEIHVDSSATNGLSRLRLSASGENQEATISMNGYLGQDSLVFGLGSSGDGSATERMRIDSAGNVGIGTASPTGKFHIYGSDPAFRIQDSNGGNIQLGQWDSVTNRIEASGGNRDLFMVNYGTGAIRFGTNGANERARLDSSGNLLFGGTTYEGSVTSNASSSYLAATGFISANVTNDFGMQVNRTGTDGKLFNFRRDGLDVGSIGSFNGASLSIDSYSTGFLSTNGVNRYAWDEDRIYPRTDNLRDLGLASYRFDDVYATNGTIQTSDRNEKQDIEVLNEAEQRVAQACKGLLRKFRWKDSVAEKGDDARIHFGIIAQDLQDAFTAEGLDAGQYAMFISATWTDEETGEERTRLGVRYPELLAFIISAL